MEAREERARWPAGHRAAVVITIDVDGDTWLKQDHGAAAVGKHAIGQYDTRAGMQRLLRALADYGVHGTVFWVGVVAEGAPGLVRQCHDEGHEIACHSWAHTHYDLLTAEQQRADLERTRDLLTRLTGETPIGHKTGGFAPGAETTGVLQSLGFRYQMDFQYDDLPELIRPDPALPPVVHLPPTWFMDDYSVFGERLLPLDDAFALWRETTDQLRDEGGFVGVTLHPHLMGRPAPARMLARYLEYVIDLGDVWIDRADRIAQWWLDRAHDVGRDLDPTRRTRPAP
jgi:peptidoglycan/xylan/chitin deacetylase (PgdA/CDA1 family)